MNLRLGIIGCGQLGQMLGLAAHKLGVQVCFLMIDEDPVVEGIGPIFDESQIDEFIASSDFVTLEREAIPDELLRRVAEATQLSPSYDAFVKLRQRHEQKSLFDALGIPTAAWVYADSQSDLQLAMQNFPVARARAKRVLGGYDGGGQWSIDTQGELPTIPESAFPLMVEAEIDVEFEVSVLMARSKNGDIQAYPVNYNVMRNGVLTWSFVPAKIDDAMAEQARTYAATLMHELDYVGVLAMEFFVSKGELVANEIAPRVHNTGHWTIEGCVCDQFEQHVRAVMNMALHDPKPAGAAALCNILGDQFPKMLPSESVRMYLHGYGKALRPGRKMGHLTLVGPGLEAVLQATKDIGIDV